MLRFRPFDAVWRRTPATALLCASIALALSGCPDPDPSADASLTFDARVDQGDAADASRPGDGGRIDLGPMGGGSGDGGTADAATDRGTGDGGLTDRGITDGGQSDGGQSDGGQSDGGPGDGGGFDGAIDGGTPDGAMPDVGLIDDVLLLDVVADGCGTFVCTGTGPQQAPVDLPDGAVHWTLNGEAIDGGVRLEGAVVANDDRLRCSVQSDVGGEQLEVESLDHIVALPTLALASLTLRPLEPVLGEPLECLPFGADTGRCALAPTFAYAWRIDGALIAGADQALLDTDALLGGEAAHCEVQVELAGRIGPVQISNEVVLDALAINLPAVELQAPDGADGDLTCAVVDARGINVALGAWLWQINDGAAFTAEAVLEADRVRSCDRVRCWFEITLGADTLRSNRPEALMPLGGDCGAADVCGVPACHPDGGCAIDAQNGAECDAGNACVVDGQCADGACVGRALRCDDGDPCTDDRCSPVDGCVAAPSTGAVCDDGDACTADDACVAGACAGTPICECEADADCASANPCVDGTCEAGACVLANNVGACDDGDACTANDVCAAGQCAGVALESVIRFRDADGDGFGLADDTVDACGDVPGYGAEVAGDCDDADGQVNPNGEEFSDDGRDSNCDGFELFAGNRLQLEGPINAPTYNVGISGEFDMGELGLLVVEGRTSRNQGGPVQWSVSVDVDHGFGDVTLSGATVTVSRGIDGRVVANVNGAGRIALFDVNLTGTVALTAEPADYALEATGDVTIEGQNGPVSLGRNRSFARRTNGVSDWQLELEIGELFLAPGVEFTGASLIARADGVALRAGVEFGAPPEGLALEVRGSYTFDGPLALRLGLPAGAGWAPLGDGFPLRFEELFGEIIRDADGAVEASITVEPGAIELSPGLTLADSQVVGRINDMGAWSVSLAGDWLANFGDGVDRTIRITGEIDAEELVLTGETPTPFQPLAGLLGEGRFVISATDDMPFAIGVILNRVDESVTVTFDSPFSLCSIGECDADQQATGMVHASGTIGMGGFNGIFRGLIQGLELPLLGELPALALVATTEAADGVDLFGDGEIERDLIRGITLAVRGESPIPLEGLGEVLFILSLGPDGLDVAADFDLEIPIIRAEDDFPTITHVTLDRVAFFAELRLASAEMGIESSVVFQPSNQDEELTGNIRLGVTSAGDAAGEMNIEGRWLEPAGLRNFAVQNPGFTIKVNFATGIPTPSSFGWNFDLFWKKNGDWPAAVPVDGEPTPANLLSLGSSFFFDKTPTDGTFCPVGVCPPSPPFLVRFDLQNLTLDDVVAFINDATALALDAASVVAGALGETVPDAGLATLDPSPITIDVQQLALTVATHDIELLGQPFEAGVAATINVTIQGRQTFLTGRLDANGLALRGAQDGIAFPPAFALVGDPLWRALDVSGDGSLRAPSDPRLDVGDGTVELWINGADLCATESELFNKIGSMRLYTDTCEDGLARLVMAYGAGVGGRTIRTVPSVASSEDVHIAVVFFGEQVSLYVNGARALVESDDLPGQVLQVNANPWSFGGVGGVDRIDDVRVWNTRLSAADLTAHARRLPTRFLNARGAVFPDSPLVVRYEFDFDEIAARNSREYFGGATLGGTLRGGAETVLRVDDNPVQFNLELGTAEGEGRAPGVGITAGIDVQIPLIPVPRITMAVDGLVGGGDSRLSFYARNFELFPLGLRANDTYVGSFFVGGNGRNLINNDGDFDDGVYGDFDLEALNFAGSARFELLNADTGLQQRFIQGDLLYDHEAEYLYVNAFVDLTFPFVGGEAGLSGTARYNDEAMQEALHALIVNGDLVLFDQRFAGLEFEVSTEQIRFNTDWNVPVPGLPEDTLLGLEAEYILSFADRTFCATARPMVAGNQCDLQVCFFHNRAPDISGCGLPECGDGQCAALVGVEQCGFGESPNGAVCEQDCGLCDDFSVCDNDNDCTSNNCLPTFFCGPACGNGACDLGEICAGEGDDNDLNCNSDCGTCECGDGVCNALEVCGSDNAGLNCNDDCGTCADGARCDGDDDCDSGNCSLLGFCVDPVFCGDGECSGVALGEQCGRGDAGNVCQSECGLCELAGFCDNNDDCESGSCVANVCVPRCGDGACHVGEFCGQNNNGLNCNSDCGSCVCGDDICNGVEVCGSNNNGLNCNDDCGTCGLNARCDGDNDCDSGNCSLLGFCVPEVYCGDGECSGAARGEGCGNGNSGNVCQDECGLCDLAGPCDRDNDCLSGDCLGGRCVPRCGDGACHAGEVCGSNNAGLNCNDDCGLCPQGGRCDGDNDCQTGNCSLLGFCVPEIHCGDGTCSFGAELCGNGDGPSVCETDCGECDLGGVCNNNNDCQSGSCLGAVCVSRCGDGTCHAGEFCSDNNNGLNCNADCGSCVCGDGTCNGVELCGANNTGLRCNRDCGLCPSCGDGVCNGLELCGATNIGPFCRRDCGRCN